MPDFWKHAPSGREFAPSDSLNSYFDSSFIDQLIDQAKSTHVSWLGPNTPARFPKDGEQQNNLNRFLNTIGYRFVGPQAVTSNFMKKAERRNPPLDSSI
ncbi:hypothetical protein [Brevibacillus daliensis]|uniref:hypothetical protein n=1 Tax=Brevibacillus daliensis TaxID=2892995 RepID=UPI001E316A6F|nr:hypothetical protein [Brevibacillus daliensis]